MLIGQYLQGIFLRKILFCLENSVLCIHSLSEKQMGHVNKKNVEQSKRDMEIKRVLNSRQNACEEIFLFILKQKLWKTY